VKKKYPHLYPPYSNQVRISKEPLIPFLLIVALLAVVNPATTDFFFKNSIKNKNLPKGGPDEGDPVLLEGLPKRRGIRKDNVTEESFEHRFYLLLCMSESLVPKIMINNKLFFLITNEASGIHYRWFY
jgi:hypothetical protein